MTASRLFATAPRFALSLLPLLLVASGLAACEPAPSGPDPSFRLTSLTGEEISPADYEGEVVIVDFWATWCVPCRRQAEILDEVHERWDGKGVRFLAVNVAEPEDLVRDYVRDNPFPYPVLLDPDDTTSAFMGLQALPTVLVLGHDGEIVYLDSGIATGPRLEEAIREGSAI